MTSIKFMIKIKNEGISTSGRRVSGIIESESNDTIFSVDNKIRFLPLRSLQNFVNLLKKTNTVNRE